MAFRPSNFPNGFANGVTIRNVPIDIVPEGQVHWVDSNAAINSDGKYNTPFATVADAITKAAEYDTIMIKAGHAEALTATSFAVTKALTIIGQGRGSRKPTFTTAVVGGVIAITDADVTISNIRLVCNYTGGSTNAITLDAASDYCTLDNIDIRDTTNAKEWLIHVSVATTVTDLVIQNCSFIGLSGGTMTNSILYAGTSTDNFILNNIIIVDSSDDVIDHLTAASTNLTVSGNVVYNIDADAAGYCLRYKSDGTGIACNNILAYNKTDAEVVLGAAAWFFENYASNTVGESGKLDPANSAAIP